MATSSTGAPAHRGPIAGAPQPDGPVDRRHRLRTAVEIWIVLGLSLGQSAVYALVSIIERATRGTPLADQSAQINVSQSSRPWLDLTYQLLSIAFALVPVALALYLLSTTGRRALRSIGLDLARPLRDVGWGLALAAGIGVPGLGLYAAGRALGVTVDVQAATLNALWWTVPVLVLAAAKNALLEEVIVVGYLSERLGDLGWGRVKIVVATSLLRGSYHLYQGFGPFVGNAIMGVVFTSFYLSRWGRRRVMPLVVAHTLLDVVAFVGYQMLPDSWLRALGIG